MATASTSLQQPASNDAGAFIQPSTSNSRGIPAATFIEDISSWISSVGIGHDKLTKQLHTLYGKYKFMESQLVTQQRTLHNKIPEIKSALQSVQYLQSHLKDSSDPINLHFELSDSLYANASVEPANSVLLWLGANVMLEYDYDEAEALLSKNLKNAETSLTSLESDIEFLKDQITISEVNISRLHNYGIAQKQLAAAETKSKTSSSSSSSQQSVGQINGSSSAPVSSSRSFAQAAGG